MKTPEKETAFSSKQI